MNDNKIKRRDTSYTAVAVKDGKKRFFFSELHLDSF